MAAILTLVVILLLPFLMIVGMVLAARMEAKRHPWSFRISRAISDTFLAMRLAPLVILGTALFASALPMAVMSLFFGLQATNLFGALSGTTSAIGLVGALLSWLLLGTLAELVMLRAALDALAGTRVAFGEALATGLRLLLAGMAVRLLFWIPVGLGFLFLVIPGLLLLLTWLIAMPVLVGERAGVFACFTRSSALVRGARWRLLLLMMLAFVAWSLVSGLTGAGTIFTVGAGSVAFAGRAIAQVAVNTLLSAVGAAGGAAIYHQLKSEREGLAGQELESVFA